MWEKIKELFGFTEYDPYVRDYIEERNMKALMYICSFVIFVETWMIFRIFRIVVFGAENRSVEWVNVHLWLYVILLASSIAMIWYAITSLRGRKRPYRVTRIWKIVFTVICTAFGMYVSYLDYVKGEQIMSFLTMILFVACLLIWRPWVSILILTASFGLFYYMCDRKVPASVATDVNMFTTYVAMVMISFTSFHQCRSEALKDKNLEDISNRDDITGIANMHHFRTNARTLLKQAAKDNRSLALIYLDVFNFKTYNERYGYNGGNNLLAQIGNDIETVFPNGEIARMSDDHFIVLADVEDPIRKVELLQEKVYDYRGDVFLKLKAGIYETDPAGGDADEDISSLCDKARFAIGNIKGSADSLYCLYDKKLHDTYRRKHYIVNHIDTAVREGWIRVYYQPIIDAASDCVCALEALARWHDPDLGILPPGEFIETLEEFRLIHKLDACIIELVCKDISLRKELKQKVLPVSLNLSRLDFELTDVAQLIISMEDKYGVDREYLEIEITESALTRNTDALNEAMNSLRISKHNLWLDDFGAGYSSFNVLKDYSFDVLKIDMKFLENFGKNDRFKPIIRSIIGLCNELNMISLAEGVETEQEYEFLKENGCARMQGYLFSKPVPLDDLIKLFEEGRLKA